MCNTIIRTDYNFAHVTNVCVNLLSDQIIILKIRECRTVARFQIWDPKPLVKWWYAVMDMYRAPFNKIPKIIHIRWKYRLVLFYSRLWWSGRYNPSHKPLQQNVWNKFSHIKLNDFCFQKKTITRTWMQDHKKKHCKVCMKTNTSRPRQNGRYLADDNSNAFSLIKVCTFWWKFHLGMCPRVWLIASDWLL